jgi:hypothetical protein
MARVRATVGRHATIDDVVPLISCLTAPGSRWINGQEFQGGCRLHRVDGLLRTYCALNPENLQSLLL